MDDEDLLALIRLVEGNLREFGHFDLADESHYLIDDGEGSVRMMEPRDHLIALLENFDTRIMLRDGAVVRRAMQSINESCRGEGPRNVVSVIPDRSEGSRILDLAELPDMSEIRSDLRSLIAELGDLPRGGGGLMEL